ncbi:MAG: L-seryl-tRNA(Sec) selenium transferase [Desulfovibrio sp.]|nr:MAG: L-seryl-tRNA(Sec) selenium transferase [Desulfovibrio sp.]
MSTLYKHLPATDAALDYLAQDPALAALPRPMVKDLINEYLDGLRREVGVGRITDSAALSLDSLGPDMARFVREKSRPSFRRVLNATGVVVHTNLGRSLLSKAAMRAVAETNEHYANLELDLATGKRGSRYSHVESLLTRITGAEAALVVNNNAAAVLLVLATLAKGREVIVSRGELVEIGGSFRIPEVMAASGATLREVGATNRTHLKDYQAAVNDATGALMKVHASNFRIIGFTHSVATSELAELARRLDLPLIEDLGSGNLVRFQDYLPGLSAMEEPTVQETVASGADIVTFSGDKVLGGPQAGIIVGNKEYVERIKANPMNRALRIDKMTLAALEATLRVYLDPDLARDKIPTLAMILADPATLKSRATRLRNRIRKALGHALNADTLAGVSRVGGGAFPEHDLETTLVALEPGDTSHSTEDLRQALLNTNPPLLGRVEDNQLCLDPRTLADEEFPLVVSALEQALALTA